MSADMSTSKNLDTNPRIHIRNGIVVDPANDIHEQRDVFIRDGKILAVSNKVPDNFNADSIIDVTGHIVCPGLVDMCARLREPGHESKATIASETRAAAGAGITSICCPPDTNPVIDSTAVATLIRDKANDTGKASVYTLGALTQELDGARLSEMGSLKAAGCVGVSNAYTPFKSSLILRHAMEYSASHDLVVHLHAEDAGLRKNGCIHEGQITYQNNNLELVVDLGEWWTSSRKLPLPLGGNAIRRDLIEAGEGPAICRILLDSIEYALEHREASVNFALNYARDMGAELADKFVGMYVNDWTLDYGDRGRAAVQRLLQEAADANLTPKLPGDGTIDFIEPA